MELIARGKHEVRPLLVKVGIAFALSFAGIIVAQFRSRLRVPPSRSSTRKSSSSAGLKEELRILKSEESLAKTVNGTSATTTTTTTTIVGLSPTNRGSGDEQGFLLPEFNDLLMKEFEGTGKDLESTNRSPAIKRSEIRDESLREQEIANLRSLVLSLRERERCLEMQLLEYYGMQEQETAMRELESQLKIHNVEAKLYSLKIESLQADNQRAQAQLAEHSRTKNELEEARAKLKLLKKKMKLDAQQAKEKTASLNQRISLLQCKEQKESKDEVQIERKLERLKKLEDETTELRMENLRLAEENTSLARNLESMQRFHSRVVSQAADLEEVDQLREANEKLTQDIEQLRTDRCADVEELVYLRWVNACLRYELRNYQAPPGKTVARDLSKNLSPKSEEKAKQLILEYANSGATDKSTSFSDFDSEYYSSSSQASIADAEETSIDASTSSRNASKSKLKFFHKLKKLVLGKESNRKKASPPEKTPRRSSNSERRASTSTCSMYDVIGRDFYPRYSSNEDLDNRMGIEAQADEQQSINSRSSICSRPPLDMERLRRLNSDQEREERTETDGSVSGTPYNYKKTVSEEVRRLSLGDNRMLDSDETDTPESIELKKFAYALKSARGNSGFKKRSASFSD